MIGLDRIFRRRRLYDDLAEEIRGHLDERAAELMARGMSPADARAEARRAFGNVTRVQELGREAWQWPSLESWLMDIRHAFRHLRRAPAVPTIVILTLALGMAAAATVFSWTRSVLLDPLPGVDESDRVMALESVNSSGGWTPTSWLDYRDYRRYLRNFDGLAAAFPISLSLGDETHAERRWGELVSANFFDVLRVKPAAGHFFASSLDESEGAQPSAVISWDLWQSRWHGDPAVIGSVVDVNRFPFTIVGVAPPAFHGSMPGERVEMWVPAAMLGQIVPTGGWWLRDRADRTFRVLARLKPGVSFAAAAAEVQAFGARLARANADVSAGMGGQLLPMWQSHWGMQDALRAPLLVLLAACALILLVVCANTANLLLARATGRRREFGMRVALGAPRLRLVRQLLTEASILALAGSALGLLCAVWLAHALHWLVPPFASSSLIAPRVDAGVLVFTAVIAAGVTLLAGVAPAFQGSRDALGAALADGGRAAIGETHATRARRSLVVAEMGLAMVALAGAGLSDVSVRNTRATSPGFDARNVAIASVRLTLAGYDSAHAEAFLENVTDRLRHRPGVEAAAYTDYVPLSVGGGSWEDLRVEGYAPAPAENMKLYRAAIGSDYFKTLRIPLVAGRDFGAGDDSAHARVMIVNEAFVRHFIGSRSALGLRVNGWGKTFTIVGVVADTKTYRLTEPPTPYFYVPVRQVYRPEYGYAFLVRTRANVNDAVRGIEQAVRGADPTIPVFNAMPLAEYIEAPLQAERAASRVLALLAVVATLLAALGLYGVIAYSVGQRTKEIGVRVALGASPSRVLRAVGAEAVQLLGFGLMAGVTASIVVQRVASSMLFGVGADSVLVLSLAAVVMIVIAAVATWIPARRALGVDPLVALRAE